MGAEPQKVIVLAGATATGKTAVLLKIQDYIRQRFPSRSLEVISCDAVQVYRFLNIGSAKPSFAQRQKLPHHLVDILDPKQTFSAGSFVRHCDALIPAIISRGNIPVICGGTFFYLKSFLYGIPDIPVLSGNYRAKLAALSNAELQTRLKRLDPKSSIHDNDRQRLLRACEVCLETGKPFSAYKQARREFRQQYRPLIIALDLPREELYRRINARVENMFCDGLLKEIEALQRLGYQATDPGLQAIGYKEIIAAGSPQKKPKETELLAQIQKNSRNYAKRQLCFLRQQIPQHHSFGPENAAEIAGCILHFICVP